VLGIAQDGGVPHVGCAKPCCASARASGTSLGPACLAVRDRQNGAVVLVEATPAIESQLARLGVRQGNPVDAVLITHAHVGHYLGLAHFGREVAATRALPVWGTERLVGFLEKNGPWSQLTALGQIAPRRIEPEVPFEPLPGLVVTAITVPHRDELSDTVAFKIRGERRTVLFVPDVDAWHERPELLEKLLDGVDLAFLDGTFWDGRELPGRNLNEIPHPPMVDTMHRLAERAKARPGTLRFIHLNHTNPALRDPEIRRRIEAAGFAVAQEGERHPL